MSWTDSTTASDPANCSGGAAITTRSANRRAATTWEDRGGIRALRLEVTATYQFNGSGEQGGAPFTLDGSGVGTGVQFLASDGRYLGGELRDSSTLTIDLPVTGYLHPATPDRAHDHHRVAAVTGRFAGPVLGLMFVLGGGMRDRALAQVAPNRATAYLTPTDVGDVRALWVNPAGLAAREEAAVLLDLTVQEPGSDGRLAQVSTGFNARGLAFGYQRDNFTNGIHGHTYRLGLGGASRGLAFGAAVALYRGATSGTGWDFGIRYDWRPQLTIGGAVRNVGKPTVRGVPLEADVRPVDHGFARWAIGSPCPRRRRRRHRRSVRMPSRPARCCRVPAASCCSPDWTPTARCIAGCWCSVSGSGSVTPTASGWSARSRAAARSRTSSAPTASRRGPAAHGR